MNAAAPQQIHVRAPVSQQGSNSRRTSGSGRLKLSRGDITRLNRISNDQNRSAIGRQAHSNPAAGVANTHIQNSIAAKLAPRPDLSLRNSPTAQVNDAPSNPANIGQP